MIKTLVDVKTFIDTLYATDMIWHADDLVIDIPNFASLTNKEALQDAMNQALDVCAENNCSIFDYYNLED